MYDFKIIDVIIFVQRNWCLESAVDSENYTHTMEMEEIKPCPNRSPIGTDGTAMFFVGEDILIKGKVSDTCICTVFIIFLLAEANCLLLFSKRGLFPPQLAKMQVSLIDARTCMNLYKLIHR